MFVSLILKKILSFQPFNSNTKNVARLANDLWANVGQFPFQVSIRAGSPSNGRFQIYSGAIISSNFVLTSARCALNNQEFHLRFNSVTHYTGGETQISYDARIHPNYNPQTFTNDVGLIRLPQALTSILTRRIELPTSANLNLDGRVAVLTAWGRDQSGETSPVLQYAWTHISLANAPRCRNLWSSNGQLPPASDNTAICATEIFEAQPPSRLCAGDSGSPLVVQGLWMIISIFIKIIYFENGMFKYRWTQFAASWYRYIQLIWHTMQREHFIVYTNYCRTWLDSTGKQCLSFDRRLTL